MCWLLYCLARHPDEQDLVVNEIDHIFGDDKNRPCTSQDFSEMKYLECCIKEALRLYTSIPNVSRELTEDVVVGRPKKLLIDLKKRLLFHIIAL